MNQVVVQDDCLRGQAEAAAYKHVSPRTISDWQRKRIIPFVKIGKKCVLFSKSKIDKALERFTVESVQ